MIEALDARRQALQILETLQAFARCLLATLCLVAEETTQRNEEEKVVAIPRRDKVRGDR